MVTRLLKSDSYFQSKYYMLSSILSFISFISIIDILISFSINSNIWMICEFFSSNLLSYQSFFACLGIFLNAEVTNNML